MPQASIVVQDQSWSPGGWTHRECDVTNNRNSKEQGNRHQSGLNDTTLAVLSNMPRQCITVFPVVNDVGNGPARLTPQSSWADVVSYPFQGVRHRHVQTIAMLGVTMS